MSDILSLGTVADADSPSSSGSSLDTGVLRRKYNFGDRVSELAVSRILSLGLLVQFLKNLQMILVSSSRNEDNPSINVMYMLTELHQHLL